MFKRRRIRHELGVELWEERGAAGDMLLTRYAGVSEQASRAFNTVSYVEAQAWFAREVRRSRALGRGRWPPARSGRPGLTGTGPGAWLA